MGGSTSVMPVIRDTFSQQAADTISWTVRCDWLQVASSRVILDMHNNTMLTTAARLPGLLANVIIAAITFSRNF